MTLNVEDNGRSLFNLLDANRDGLLSIREMRTGWERVKSLCKDGTGLVQTDLSRSLRITMAQGNANNGGFAVPVAFGGPMMAGRPGSSLSVPAWFRKMDRNNDGDISPKEWLGTDEEFRMLDTDGDGLISGEEAMKYEARLKKKEPDKKQAPAQKPATATKPLAAAKK